MVDNGLNGWNASAAPAGKTPGGGTFWRGEPVGRPGQDGQSAFNLAEYWRLALKHRILIVAAFIAALIVGLAITLLTTPIYTASTTIQIDREAARVFNVDDSSPQESMAQGEEFFQTQYGLLRSRSLSERVVDSLGLASSEAFFEAMNMTPPASPGGAAGQIALRREAAIGILRKNLDIQPTRGSRLVEVSFSSPDAALSARISNAYAENFIQSNLDRKFESSLYAREFLEDRIAQTKTKLEDAERQLVAYATQQQIINVSEGDGGGESQSLASNNLVVLNNSLATATNDRIAAEEKWRQTRASPNNSLPEIYQNLTIQNLTSQRATLQSQYELNLGIYKADFPTMLQMKAQIEELDRQIATVGNGIRNSIREQYQVTLNQERALRNQVDGLKADVLDLRDRSIQYNILQREVDTSRTLYDGLLQRYKEVGVTGGVTTNNVSIVDQAEAPHGPSSPNMLINLAIAALLGLGIGALASLAIEALDETLATPEDVESKLGVPVLGAVPKLEKGVSPMEALADTRSSLSESYHSLRTALQFSTPDGAPRSILVTSSRPAEGKSTTSFALAQNLARVGKKVLLVDADLRNPSMHRLVGVDNERGMSNLLSGSYSLDTVACETATPNMSFVPCGPLPPNPAELWGGDRTTRFLQDALATYDHVVFDGPPVLGFADAPVLAATLEGTLFVLESRGTRRGQARGALRRLNMGHARLLGLVLTKFNAKATSYGGYDYAYDYAYGGANEGGGTRKR